MVRRLRCERLAVLPVARESRAVVCCYFLLMLACLPGLAQGASKPKFEVILLGTGFPRPDPDRFGPATAVVVNGKVFLVDAGRGVVLRLAATEFPLTAVKAVLLTHLHSDHTSGLPDFFSTSWILGRKTPLELYGPKGTRAMAKALESYFAADIHIRRDLTEMNPAAGATVHVHEVGEGFVYQDSDVVITAFTVDHRPVEPAFGYKFQALGKTLVISGDTRPSDNLIRYAKGADLLIHEAYIPDYFERMHNSPELSARLRAYHSSASEAGEVARKCGAKQLVITHVIGVKDTDDERIRAAAQQNFAGKVTVGKDLMRFEIQ